MLPFVTSLAYDASWFKESAKLLPINYKTFSLLRGPSILRFGGILGFGDEMLVKEAFSQ